MRKKEPIKLSFECLEMQKRSIPTERAQRVDEKKWIVCLVIMFTIFSTLLSESKFSARVDNVHIVSLRWLGSKYTSAESLAILKRL